MPRYRGAIDSSGGEGGEGTLWLSAFIFNALGSGDRIEAPNFPPHDLVIFAIKCNKIKITL
jgi:hypothetical protein